MRSGRDTAPEGQLQAESEMGVRSMTGFARANGEAAGFLFSIELKSVNARGLELRLQLPHPADAFESAWRRRLKQRLTRGTVHVRLDLKRANGSADEETIVDHDRLDLLCRIAERYADRTGVAPARLDVLMALPGILGSAEPAGLDDVTRDALGNALTEALDAAIDGLIEARRREGSALAEVMAELLDEMKEWSERAADAAEAAVPALKKRIEERASELLEQVEALDPGRLEQEMALLAVKQDVREEIERLRVHVAAARALLAEGGAIGRKLDFLAQEMNREANTLCAKAQDRRLTEAGLALKAAIDRFREQAQNIE
ncbi:MAG: YicC family protein [Alphaproteobacteria bacterium]|nr:MAG: YicC family protein [Alphaproteobacteria bacterium]